MALKSLGVSHAGCSVSHILRFGRFNFPLKLKLASSLNTIEWLKLSSSAMSWRRNSQNSTRSSLSSSWSVCNNWILYGFIRKRIRKTRQTEVERMFSSLLGRLDFLGLPRKLWRRNSPSSSDTRWLAFTETTLILKLFTPSSHTLGCNGNTAICSTKVTLNGYYGFVKHRTQNYFFCFVGGMLPNWQN